MRSHAQADHEVAYRGSRGGLEEQRVFSVEDGFFKCPFNIVGVKRCLFDFAKGAEIFKVAQNVSECFCDVPCWQATFGKKFVQGQFANAQHERQGMRDVIFQTLFGVERVGNLVVFKNAFVKSENFASFFWKKFSEVDQLAASVGIANSKKHVGMNLTEVA